MAKTSEYLALFYASETAAERMVNSIREDRKTGCVIWEGRFTMAAPRAGAVDRYSYPVVHVQGNFGRTTILYVTKLLWMLNHGTMPKNHHLLNQCGDRACVNLKHWELKSQREISMSSPGCWAHDSVKKAKGQTHCIRGHELSGKNLYKATPNQPGKRKCKPCDLSRKQATRDKKKAAAAA